MDYHRLRWASRRGMLELDLILGPFLENVYPKLSREEQEGYHRLLQCEDQDLFNWFLNKQKPDDEALNSIVQIIMAHTGLRVER